MIKALRDTTAFYISLLVLIILCVPVLLGVGIAREWNVALVPPYTFQFKTVEDATRFWPEPNKYQENAEIDSEIAGRNFPQASGLWYYWKYRSSEYCDPEPFDPVTEPWVLSCQVPMATAGTRAFVWCCYLVHQCAVWGLVYKAQSLHRDDTNYHAHLKWYNVASLVVNCAMYLLHLLQTHVTYDALAQDVTEASSQGSVILLLVMVLVMEYKHRGLFFGWPAWNDPANKGCPTCGQEQQWSWRLPSRPIDLIRKYHGYAFSWATIYTTWYHPMESTAAHVTGFMHTGLLLIQQSLIFTPMHLNKYWRLVLETWVIIHSAVVAAQTQGKEMIGMFLFGFLWMLAFTQIHGLPYYLAFVQVDANQKRANENEGQEDDANTHGNVNTARGPSASMLADYVPFVPVQKWKRLIIRIVPVILYFVFVVVSYLTWLNNDDQSLGVQMSAIIRIPLILYLLALFVAIICWGMMFADERICACRKNSDEGEAVEKKAETDREKKSSDPELQSEDDGTAGEAEAPQATMDAEMGETNDPETPSAGHEVSPRAGVGSVGTGTVLAVLFVGYAIMVAVSVIVEAVHVQMDLIMLMVVLVAIFSVMALMVMIVMERDMRRIELGPPRLPPHMEQKEAAIDEPSKDADYSPATIAQNE